MITLALLRCLFSSRVHFFTCQILNQGWPNHCQRAKKCPPILFHVPAKTFFVMAFIESIHKSAKLDILSGNTYYYFFNMGIR